jgi:hypothetical protein
MFFHAGGELDIGRKEFGSAVLEDEILREFGQAFLRAQGRILLGAGKRAREFRLEASEPVALPAEGLKAIDIHQVPNSNRSRESPEKATYHRRAERN